MQRYTLEFVLLDLYGIQNPGVLGQRSGHRNN